MVPARRCTVTTAPVYKWTAERLESHIMAERRADERCQKLDIDERKRARGVLNAESEERANDRRQIRVAMEQGCTYWHWRDRMGGPGSMRYWVAAGLGQGDFIHLTSPGYQLVGKTLAEELLLQYQRFVNARTEADQ